MTTVPGRPFHFVTSLRAWDFSSVHVLPHVLLDRCYEGMEEWGRRNLWPMLELAVETRVMAEPFHVVLEQTGRRLNFPDDRTLLVELDGWTLYNQRKFLFECTYYRCGRKVQERFARALVAMSGVQIDDPETWAAHVGPLSPKIAQRVTEFEEDHRLAGARYQHELRHLHGAEWFNGPAIERTAAAHLCEFTDMAVFMNHAPQLAAEGQELLLSELRKAHPDRYQRFAACRRGVPSVFAVDVKLPFWFREPFRLHSRCCEHDGKLCFDHRVEGISPARTCERFVAIYPL
ncbi:MAG: hypothetical protein HYZ28_19915 [Myxococcales bacterium]|nr:hypothetical protein [Myxococcales bacterium]